MPRLATYLLLVLAPIFTVAQSASQPAEPEYANSFFLLSSSASLTPLERQTVNIGGKIHAMGFGGGESFYQIQGEQSPVRIPAGSPVEIIVKLESHDLDPATLVTLYTLTPKKGKRELQFGRSHFMGSGSKIGTQDKELQLNFSKYGQSSTKISPASPLPPGEYAIALQSQTGMPIAYCFGVDAAAH